MENWCIMGRLMMNYTYEVTSSMIHFVLFFGLILLNKIASIIFKIL